MEAIDDNNLEKLKALNNQSVLKVVNEFISLCKPSKVTVITDSQEDIDYVRKRAIELSEEDNNYNNSNGKDKRMAKMSCLKSASRILGPMDIEPNKKIRATVSVAKYFERYINNELDDEPSSNSKGKDKDKGRDFKYQDIDFGL